MSIIHIDVQQEDVPQAEGYQVSLCRNGGTMHVHLLALDADGEALCEIVMDAPQMDLLLKEWTTARNSLQ